MTKRYGTYEEKNNKKTKIEEDVDALWGDDFDVHEIDNCFKNATQISKGPNNNFSQSNVSILPSYNAFREKQTIFCSTQFDNKPGTSKQRDINIDLNDYQKIKEQCKEKEGEIAILRTNLQDTKKNMLAERERIHLEWKLKLKNTEKEIESIKSQLDFKNLEIVNLKHRILDFSKLNMMDVTMKNKMEIPKNNIENQKQNGTLKEIKNFKLYSTVDSLYPLQNCLSCNLLSVSKKEKHYTRLKSSPSCRNTIPYLQNQSIDATIILNESNNVSVEFIYADLFRLTKCSESDLNLNENISIIKKVLSVCLQLINDLNKFLQSIKNSLRTEDILEADSNYLKRVKNCVDCESHNSDKIGFKCGIILGFLSEILPFSDYLKKYICHNNSNVQNNESSTQSFLEKIFSVVKVIGETRKADVTLYFLKSSVKLLISIYKCKKYTLVSDIFCKISKELVFSKPSKDVIMLLTYLFKDASQSLSFIKYIFNNSISSNSIRHTDEIVYYNDGACCLYIFVHLLYSTIDKPRNTCNLTITFPLHIYLNLLCLLYNTFKSSYWINHKNIKDCECAPQLYKLAIEILFKAIQEYTDDLHLKKYKTSQWEYFFKHPVTVKILNLLSFNSYEMNAYELLEKFVTVFAQFKEIKMKLLENKGFIQLDNLHITEEALEIPSSNFGKIGF